MLQSAFWVAVSLVFYTYIGYPLLIQVAAHRKGETRSGSGELRPEAVPNVTVLIAAHNAAEYILQRIDNLLACDYPAAHLRIVVASDGSTDGTADRVRRHSDPRVAVLDFAVRRGKAATLADAVQRLETDVIVFTDAATYFRADSLLRLTRHFADPTVGIAAGEVGIMDGAGKPIEAFYWRQEMRMRRCEARLGILIGASGAMYAIRRSLFVTPSRPVINDDLVLPTLAQLKHGCRFVIDPSAQAYVSYTGGLLQEFRRRCRIGAGAYQALTVLQPLLHPRHAKQAWAFASRKALRWLCPFLMLIAVVTNGALLGTPAYDSLFALQIGFYGMAVVGLWMRGAGRMARLLRLTTSFCVMNLALLAGFFRWVFDTQQATWHPTPRPNGGCVPLAGGAATTHHPIVCYSERAAV